MKFICQYCEKEFTSKIGVKTHEYKCKKNPLYKEHFEKYSKALKKAAKNRRRPSKYFEYTSFCEKCGKEFTQLTTESLIKLNKHKRCCSSACSHSRNHSNLTKNKTKNTLKKFYENKRKIRLNNALNTNNIADLYFYCKSKSNRGKEIKKHICHFCGKEIYGKYENIMYCYECAEKRGLENLQLYTSNKEKIPSNKQLKARELSRDNQLRLIAEGRHKGWQSRNLVSYPEQFWKKVLDNNGITYSFNHVVNKKKDLGLKDISNYFLDFLIDNKIDLEIDGKQHKYPDRIKSDKRRDSLLKEAGYIVYRVEWNEINSGLGQNKMKQKIQDFLDFYKTYENNRDINTRSDRNNGEHTSADS